MAKIDLKRIIQELRDSADGVVRSALGRTDVRSDQHGLPPRPSRLLEGIAANSGTGLLVALVAGFTLTSLTFVVVNTFFFGSILSHYRGWTALRIDEVAAAYARVRGTSVESVAGDKFASELKSQLQLELEHWVVDKDSGDGTWEVWRGGFGEPQVTSAIRLLWSPRAGGTDPNTLPQFKFALELRREDSGSSTDIIAEYYPLEPIATAEVGVFERTRNREERVFHPVTIYHFGLLGLRPIQVLSTSEELAARFFLELQDFAADGGVESSVPDGTQAELTQAFIREILARRLGRVSGGMAARAAHVEADMRGDTPPPVPALTIADERPITYQTTESMTAWARRVNGSDLLGFIQYGTIVAFWSLVVVLLAKRQLVSLQESHFVTDEFDPSNPEPSLNAIIARRTNWRNGRANATPCIPLELMYTGYAAYAVAHDYTAVSASVEGRSQSFLEQSGTSFAVVRFLIWLIPSIGFIGTVLGIGNALLGTGAVLSDQQVEQQAAIQLIASRLGTAFDTTFIALIVSIPAMFLMNVVQRQEEELIHEGGRAALDVIISPKGVQKAATAAPQRPAISLRGQEPVRVDAGGSQRYIFRSEHSKAASSRPVVDVLASILIALVCIVMCAYVFSHSVDQPVRTLIDSLWSFSRDVFPSGR